MNLNAVPSLIIRKCKMKMRHDDGLRERVFWFWLIHSITGYPITPMRGATPSSGRRSPRPAPPPRATPINCLTTEVVSLPPFYVRWRVCDSCQNDWVLIMNTNHVLAKELNWIEYTKRSVDSCRIMKQKIFTQIIKLKANIILFNCVLLYYHFFIWAFPYFISFKTLKNIC